MVMIVKTFQELLGGARDCVAKWKVSSFICQHLSNLYYEYDASTEMGKLLR